MKKSIVVLYGGKSGEHEVSLQSAASVVRNLDRERYSIQLIGITGDGRWFLQPQELSNRAAADIPNALPISEEKSKRVYVIPEGGLACAEGSIAAECVFPVLHGPFGEDGTVQGLLEVANIPYVGAGVLGSALGMDKDACKRIWQHAGLPVVAFDVLYRHDYLENRDAAVEALLETRSFPLFVKPARVGSSVGISKVTDGASLHEALESAFRFDTKLLVEPAIVGRELECSVVGNHNPRAFTLGEVVPTHEFYTYEAKYLDPDGAGLEIPARIEERLAEEMKRIAVQAYRAAGVEGLARVDFFVNGEGAPLLNEINTIPGFTRISMFPMLCAEDGLEYGALLQQLIELALERHSEQASLSWSYQ